MPTDRGVNVDRKCAECGRALVKKPGPGRWPKFCDEHRSSRGRVLLTDEERRAVRVAAGHKRWDTWQSPEMKAAASAHAKAGAAIRWAGHVPLARGCGHPADRSESGSMPRYCPDCLGAPLECRWEGCSVVVGSVGGRGARAKWCSEHLAEKKRHQPKDSPSRECSEPGCTRPVRARGVCNMHYKRILRDEGRLVEQPWNDRRKNNHYRRKALMTGADAEDVQLSDVIDRDGECCGICGAVVDFAIVWPAPGSPSLDHVIPLSRGGSHTLGNCQLSHLRCNLSKGARVPEAVS